MAHIRRKFVDVHKAQGSAIAEEAIKRSAQLYAVEKEARGQPPAIRQAIRQDKAKPILDDLEAWLHAQLPKISGKTPLAGAIRYALTRIKRLRLYLDHGILELDNNTAREVKCWRAATCVVPNTGACNTAKPPRNMINRMARNPS